MTCVSSFENNLEDSSHCAGKPGRTGLLNTRDFGAFSHAPSIWDKATPAILSERFADRSLRCYSTRSEIDRDQRMRSIDISTASELTHVSSSGAAQMVSINSKEPTSRFAVAMCSVFFANCEVLPLIMDDRLKKGDVLQVARIAGIMAAKRTSDLIPLCHPIAIDHVGVDLDISEAANGGISASDEGKDVSHLKQNFGSIEITATVSCRGKTGVEMDALTAASAAALTVYDMCKAVDKGMRIEGLRIVKKVGGKSGTYIEGKKQDED